MRRFAILCFVLLVAGCSNRKAYSPTTGHVIFKSDRLGTKEQIGRVEYRSAAGDIFVLEGYHSDQVEALKEVAKAAAEGAVRGLVPQSSSLSALKLITDASGNLRAVPKDDPSFPVLVPGTLPAPAVPLASLIGGE